MIITLKGADFSGAGNNIGNLSQIGGTFTFTINPTPSDATVKINGTARKSITGAYGTAISWEVSKDGYNTRTGSLTMPLGGKTMSVSLTAVGSTTPPVTPPVTPDPEPEQPGTGGGTGGDVDFSEVQIEVTLLANSYISKDNGELVTHETYKNWTATEYISVNANEKYRVVANTFTGGSSGVGAAVYGYDSNKTPLVCILGETDASSGAMFSIPENVKYIRVGTIKTKCAISLFKSNIPDDVPSISWIANQYVSKETTGTTPVAAGTIKEASGWTTTNYIDVSKYKKLTYTATIPTGGISTVHCVYGYDSNKNPIKPILTPTAESNTFNNYLIEIVDSDIAYIVACGHSKTMVPSISFTN